MAKNKKLPTTNKAGITQVQNGGRKPTPLDAEKIEIMAASFLPVEKIAKILGVTDDVLYDRFSGALQKGRESRRYDLACAMWHKGLVEKDTKMLIWLSKQHLGYKDTIPEAAQVVNFNVVVNEVPK